MLMTPCIGRKPRLVPPMRWCRPLRPVGVGGRCGGCVPPGNNSANDRPVRVGCRTRHPGPTILR
jgi:hypothetical protein